MGKRKNVRRGEIYYVNLNKQNTGTEASKQRPCIILQCDEGNIFSSTTIIAPITKVCRENPLVSHVWVEKAKENGLKYDSMIKLEQIRMIDLDRVCNKIGKVDRKVIEKIDKSLIKCLAINVKNNSI